MQSLLNRLKNINVAEKWRYITDQYVTEQAILINKLLSTFGRPTSYLEIGVDEGRTFKKIKSAIKHGVDPYGTFDVTHRMTSEMFFALNKEFFHNTYDVIFIDASHFSRIVDNEIREALSILNKRGYIVLHDTDPLSRESSNLILSDILSYLKSVSFPYNHSHTASLAGKTYNGDVWKSIARLRMHNSHVNVFSVEGFCCTVVKVQKQKKRMKSTDDNKLTWRFFVQNRKNILNPIPFASISDHLY